MAEVAYLVSFIVRVLDKSNLEFMVGGRFKLNRKAVGGYRYLLSEVVQSVFSSIKDPYEVISSTDMLGLQDSR